MAEVYNAGFYLQYLWEKRQQTDKSKGIDLQKRITALSCFTIDQFGAHKEDNDLSEDNLWITYVYNNLISRGLPTLPSLLVEQSIVETLKPLIPLKEDLESKSRTIRYINGKMSNRLEQEWQSAIIRSHFHLDYRLSAQDYDGKFESECEQTFFQNLLPLQIGQSLMQLVESQRTVASIVGSGFKDQRVDFAIESDLFKAVFEVDGPQHQAEPQKTLDKRRDAALKEKGWQTIRVPVKDISDPQANPTIAGKWTELKQQIDVNPITQIFCQNGNSPLWKNDVGLRALMTVLSPFAVARFQKILILAIQDRIISWNDGQWNVVAIERDVPFAALALVDFFQHIQTFQSLIGAPKQLPQVNLLIYGTTEFKPLPASVTTGLLEEFGITVATRYLSESDDPEDFNGDLLVDISMLASTGFLPLQPSFIANLLHSTGIAYVARSITRSIETRRLRTCQPRPLRDTSVSEEHLTFFLRNIFRKWEFRPKQFDILSRALALEPVIGLLPTGAGKSICYQLAGLLQPGLTLVVDPLVSLMNDQFENLKTYYAIDWVGFISSQKNSSEKEKIAQQMIHGEIQFIFISPERLQSQKFRDYLTELTRYLPVAYAVIDEAHCVSEWGHDFRTSYLKLGKTLLQYCRFQEKPPTLIALTGTASYAVLSDVQREIHIESENAKIFPDSFKRPELFFGVITVPSDKKKGTLLSHLQYLKNKCGKGDDFFASKKENTNAGIVFTPHVNGLMGAYPLSLDLANKIPTIVDYFSGEVPIQKNTQGKKVAIMTSDEFQKHKLKVQQQFKNNEFALLVATKAFGMGIDKPNIRYTVHYSIPHSLEAFYQEAGRAGRDKKEAHCWLIFSDDNAEEANRLLSPNMTCEEISNTVGKNWGGGDIHRSLFLHTNAYKGESKEMQVIRDLLKDPFGKKLLNGTYHVLTPLIIPFGSIEEQQARDKALYRLSILGLIQDYTIDYNSRVFAVTAERLPDEEYIQNLRVYIQRYKTREVSDFVANKVNAAKGDTTLEKCATYLIEFVYHEIERKRRAAIRTMVEITRGAAEKKDPTEQNKYMWDQVLSYLEQSPFTEDLDRVSKDSNPEFWHQVLQKKDNTGVLLLQTVDGVRQLLGGCRRALESDPDNPGLLFLNGLARLLLPEPEIERAMEDIGAALNNLTILSPYQQEAAALIIWMELRDWLKNTREYDKFEMKLADTIVDRAQTRNIVRELYPVIPERCENILLNLALNQIQHIRQNLNV